MKRVKLVVAYDGTNYCGWQVQPNGITIEGVLNRELSKLLKEDIVVIGASRTDSGVHSYGNVAVFDTNARMPAEKISYALNQRLPDDIVVQNSSEIPLDWHPRHCNSRKTYEYRILNREFPMPQRRLDTWFVYRKLNIPAMCEAAEQFEGTHDFKSFCSVNTQAKSTVRTIFAIDILEEPLRADFYPYEYDDEYDEASSSDELNQSDNGSGSNEDNLPDNLEDYDVYELAYNHTFEGRKIVIRINGDGFLYNMVRIITGTLVDVGKGRFKPETVANMLRKTDRTYSGPTAPPQGLSLINIDFMI